MRYTNDPRLEAAYVRALAALLTLNPGFKASWECTQHALLARDLVDRPWFDAVIADVHAEIKR